MTRTIRHAALAGVLLLATACGGDDSSTDATSAPVTESPATDAPDTAAPDTAAPETAAPDTAAPDTAAPDTMAPDTMAPDTAAPQDTEAPEGDLWVPTDPTQVPEVTAAIDPAWIESSGETIGTDIADGQYWAQAMSPFEGAQSGITLSLSQAFFGSACTSQFPGDDDACMNDYGVLDDPSGEFPAFLGDLQRVAVIDGMTQQSYIIDGPELAALVSGADPSIDVDFSGYVGFPFIATVSGGKVVALEQLFVP